MLRERIQLDDKGRLLRGRFYFYRIFVCKYKVSYPNSGAGAMVTLYLFGFLPIGRFALSEQMFMQGCIGGGGLPQCKRKYTLDASHIMAQNIAQELQTDDIKQKLEKLLSGLDSQSVACVNRILARLNLTFFLKNKKIHTLTKEEKHTLKRIKSEFYSHILTLKDCYFYNGWFLPIKHFEVSVFWHKHSLYMIKNWDKIKQKNIIDVGGYIGDSTLILQDYTTQKIYSFEAVSENYDLMCKTLKLNHISNVVPIKKALGAGFEQIKIARYGGASSASIFRSDDFEWVEMITLDSFVKEHQLEVGFIKVDIEGFEMSFLKGALETIKTQKPAMLISIYHQGSDFFGIKPFLEDLNLGYTFKVHKPIDESVSGETCLFCEVCS